MKFLIYFLLSFFYVTINIYSQVYEKVGPNIKVGNFWIHRGGDPWHPEHWTAKKREVVKDTVINSLTYYKVRFTYSYSSDEFYKFYRVNDSSYLAVYLTFDDEPARDWLYYKLHAQPGDSWTQKLSDYVIFTDSILEVFTANVWNTGIDTIRHLFVNDSVGIWGFSQIWSDKYGMLNEWGDGFEERLVGCYLDGVAYGDTNLVTGIDDDINVNNFELYQNYPNPFNPETKIKYSIQQLSDVSITVYDALGREVALLVNEEKPAGIYEVNFNGNDLASGIYIYKLQAGDYLSTRKMILMK